MKKILSVIACAILLLSTSCIWGQSYPVTDGFSGSGPLSSSWAQVQDTGQTAWSDLVRSSGTAVPSASTSKGLAMYTGVTFTDDQYAQTVFVAHSSGGTTGPCVEMNAVGTGYCYLGDLGKVVAFYYGVYTAESVLNCSIPSSGDVVRLSINGTTLTCTNVTTNTSASGSIPSGYYIPGPHSPGVMVDQRSSGVYALASFQADCIPTCSTAPPSPAAAPVFSPVAGSYSSAQTVTISSATAGTTIYYTVDGSTPTTSSTVYSGPISVASTKTVSALAVKTGYSNSAVASATYTITGYPVTDGFSGSGPLSSSWTQVQDTGQTAWSDLVRSSGTAVPSASASKGLAMYTGATFTDDQYAQTVFVAHSSGSVTGPCVEMNAVGTGYCYLGDYGKVVAFYYGVYTAESVLNCPTPSGGDTVRLSITGTTLTCTDITTGVSASGSTPSGYYIPAPHSPGVMVDQRSSSAYALAGFQADCVPTCSTAAPSPVATSVFSPGAGSYSSAQTVSISSATSGATIYYTVDGSTPTTSSAAYSGPITVASTQTVSALAVKTEYSNSAVASATYTITGGVNPPSKVEISPKGVALRPGSTYQFTATCTYLNGTSDNCAAAGGAVWSTSTSTSGYFTVTSSGLATAAVDPAQVTDPGTGQARDYISGFIAVTAGVAKDRAGIITQSTSPQRSTWYQYIVPQYNAGDFVTSNSINLPVLTPITTVIGSTVTIGSYADPTSAINTYGGHAGALLQDVCNWTSSNQTVATVDRYGHVTSLAPGSVSITCVIPGDAVYGQSTQPGWVSPGNVIDLTVVNGGTSNQTWYVRPNGGSIWNAASSPNGQCDGLADVDYPGAGTGLHCAVNNLRNLWADNANYYVTKWAIAGGDTVIVRQNLQGYNVGFDSAARTQPVNGAQMPSIPSGSAVRHTRILGENYVSCGADSAKTKLFLSYGGANAFVVSDSQFVDIACFEITDKAACSRGNWTNTCNDSTDDYGGTAIKQNGFTASVTYSDLFIHGLSGAAIGGPTGIGVTGERLHLRAMPHTGIDMDDFPWGENSVALAGGFKLTDSIVEFSGCIEEYPLVHNYPFIECRDQQLGDNGDGLGTAAANGDWVFSRDIFRYNYQDGLDLLHSGLHSLLVEDSQSYGNIGQTYKIGSGLNVVFRNNIALANCNRLSETLGDEPSSAILPGIVYCRANDTIAVSLDAQGTDTFVGNTIGGYFDTTLDIFCSFESCSGNRAIFQNNLVFGSPSPWTDGNPSPGLFYFNPAVFAANQNSNAWTIETNNLFYNLRNLPSPLYTGEVVADPLLIAEPNLLIWPGDAANGEASWDGFNFHLSSSSPARGTGVANGAMQYDSTGAQRPNPPSIGALE